MKTLKKLLPPILVIITLMMCVFPIISSAADTCLIYIDSQVIGSNPDPDHVYRYAVQYTNATGTLVSTTMEFSADDPVHRKSIYVQVNGYFNVRFLSDNITDYQIGVQAGGDPITWGKDNFDIPTCYSYYNQGAICFYIRYNTAVKRIKLTKDAIGALDPDTLYHFKAISHEYNYKFIEKDYYIKAGESADIPYVYVPGQDNSVYIKEVDVPRGCNVSYSQGGDALPVWPENPEWSAKVKIDDSNMPDNVEVKCLNYYTPAAIKLTKKVVSGNPTAEGPFEFTLTVTDANGRALDISGIPQPSGFSVKNGTKNVLVGSIRNFPASSGSKTVTVNVPSGSKVTIEENNPGEDFIVSNDGGNHNSGKKAVIYSANNSTSVTFTNTRKVAFTINKTVVGDSEQSFPFEVTLKDVKLTAGTYTPKGSAAYTVDASGTITFSLQDCQKVVIQNIPYGTKATVTEKGTEYFDVAFKGANGYTKSVASDTFTLDGDKTITVENTVQFFYVVHHAVHVNEDEAQTITDFVDKIPMYTLKDTDGYFDITVPFVGDNYDFTDFYNGIRENYLYSGLYTDDSFMTPHTVDTWEETYGEDHDYNGLSLQPEAGDIFYLKEVPDEYLRPKTLSFYNGSEKDNEEETANVLCSYMITAVDSLNYITAGFVIDGENFNNEYEDGQITVDDDTVFSKIEAKMITGTATFNVTDFFSILDNENDYLVCQKIDSDMLDEYKVSGEDQPLTILPFYVTMDNIKVTGARERTMYYRETGYPVVNYPDEVVKSITEEYESSEMLSIRPIQPLKLMAVRTIGVKEEPAVQMYAITKYAEGSQTVQNVEAGSYVGKITYPEISGKRFAGWFTDSAFTTPADFSDVNGDMTVYAKYISADYLTLKFETKLTKKVVTKIRPFFAVDSKNSFDSVGFVIAVNGEETVLNVSTYSTSVSSQSAKKLFGGDVTTSAKLVIGDIVTSGMADGTVIRVKAFWTTFDGTVVYGPEQAVSYTSAKVELVK